MGRGAQCFMKERPASRCVLDACSTELHRVAAPESRTEHLIDMKTSFLSFYSETLIYYNIVAG